MNNRIKVDLDSTVNCDKELVIEKEKTYITWFLCNS